MEISPVLGQIVNHSKFGIGRVETFGFTTVTIDFKKTRVTLSIEEFRKEINGLYGELKLTDSDAVLTKENLNWIDNQFERNYFESYSKIKERYGSEIADAKIYELQADWIIKSFGKMKAEQPNLEQAKAIGSTSSKTLVTARAGSGKTRTLVNRAIFLFSKCGIDPGEMILLAFNKSAALEMQERLLAFSIEFQRCHVMTFHALAYAIVHPEEDLMTESRVIKVNNLVRELLKDKKYSGMIKKVMMGFFRTDLRQVLSGGWHLLDDKEQFLNFRRGLSNESMRGEPIKSLGEKLIADFLFENGVPYKYERFFKWGDRPYRPDFTIETSSGHGVVIEYFGLKGVPEYDSETLEKIAFWNSNANWKLISLYPSDLSSGGPTGFTDLLGVKISELGIILTPQTDEELWMKVENRGRYQFTETVSLAISKIRKRNLSPADFHQMVNSYDSQDSTESAFLIALSAFYFDYCNHLTDHKSEDHDGYVNRAISLIELGQNLFSRKASSGDLKAVNYLFIDEYQDFTEQFYLLTKAIIAINPSVNIFCVGDDWQAINTFAGSNLKYFHEYGEFFGEHVQLNLLSNFRSVPSVVNLSNQVMSGLGGRSISTRIDQSTVKVAELKSRIIAPSEDILNNGDRLTSSLAKLIYVLHEYASTNNPNLTIAILAHNRVSVPYFMRDTGNLSKTPLSQLEENVFRIIGKDVAKHVKFSTVHGFKGLQANVVILLDPIIKSFPSVHHTWRLQRIFGQDYDSLVEEERRLLYVALTRAADQLILFCNEIEELSVFFTDKMEIEGFRKLDWSTVDRTFINEVAVTVWSPTAATMSNVTQLKNSGFRYYPETKRWRRYVDEPIFRLEEIQSEAWNFGLSNTFASVEYPNKRQKDSWQIKNGHWFREIL